MDHRLLPSLRVPSLADLKELASRGAWNHDRRVLNVHSPSVHRARARCPYSTVECCLGLTYGHKPEMESLWHIRSRRIVSLLVVLSVLRYTDSISPVYVLRVPSAFTTFTRLILQQAKILHVRNIDLVCPNLLITLLTRMLR